MQHQQTSLQSKDNDLGQLDYFLVCGLGSLGQHCVLALKAFEVNVIAIEQNRPQSWEIADLSNFLDLLIIGDCRQKSILEQAKIHQCRAALIVTSDEQVNAVTALTIRQINPNIRLVVRSSKQNLNQLLSEQLKNFIAYEPTQLPASTFALAALGSETLGLFHLDEYKLQVLQYQVTTDDGFNNRSLYELNTPTRRILAHANPAEPLPSGFYQWKPNDIVQPGDILVYIEVAYQSVASAFATPIQPQKPSRWQEKIHHLWKSIQKEVLQFWQLSFQQQVRRVAWICGVIVLILLMVGTVLLHLASPNITLFSAFSATVILLLGGYADLFGEFEGINNIPWWLQLFSLSLTLIGTVFVGVLYALLTETLLSSKFQFIKNRPSVPQQDHIAIIGLGRVGRQVVTLLQEFKQAIVGITFNLDFDRTILPQMPLIVGNLKESLEQANLDKARSIVIVTNDEILNLEVALMVQKINPNSHLVIRTEGESLERQLGQILPKAQVLGTHSVAAEAFAGAAFGENIINLFHFNKKTILVTEYEIEGHDSLDGRLISDLAYGYRVIPIFYQRPHQPAKLMPADYIRLKAGDFIVVLATINGLRRIERARITPKSWRVCIEQVFNNILAQEAPTIIANISGCSLATATDLMQHLPQTLSVPLYEHQAQKLVIELKKIQVQASTIPIQKTHHS